MILQILMRSNGKRGGEGSFCRSCGFAEKCFTPQTKTNPSLRKEIRESRDLKQLYRSRAYRLSFEEKPLVMCCSWDHIGLAISSLGVVSLRFQAFLFRPAFQFHRSMTRETRRKSRTVTSSFCRGLSWPLSLRTRLFNRRLLSRSRLTFYLGLKRAKRRTSGRRSVPG